MINSYFRFYIPQLKEMKITDWLRNKKRHSTMSFMNSSDKERQEKDKIRNVFNILINASRGNIISLDWEWAVTCMVDISRRNRRKFITLIVMIKKDVNISDNIKSLFMIDILVKYKLMAFPRNRSYKLLMKDIVHKCKSSPVTSGMYKYVPPIKSFVGHSEKTNARSTVGKEIAKGLFGKDHNRKYRCFRKDGIYK